MKASKRFFFYGAACLFASVVGSWVAALAVCTLTAVAVVLSSKGELKMYKIYEVNVWDSYSLASDNEYQTVECAMVDVMWLSRVCGIKSLRVINQDGTVVSYFEDKDQ